MGTGPGLLFDFVAGYLLCCGMENFSLERVLRRGEVGEVTRKRAKASGKIQGVKFAGRKIGTVLLDDLRSVSPVPKPFLSSMRLSTGSSPQVRCGELVN